MMKKFLVNYILLAVSVILFAGVMSSCSETDDIDEEFPDWQNYNETSFAKLYAQAEAMIANGDTSWKIIRNWSMPFDNDQFTYTQKPEDCIIVHVEKSGQGDAEQHPLYTDVARVHYSGRLLPSTTYTDGYVFDKSYYGSELNEATDKPSALQVKSVVDGFSTALQNMIIGDQWTVYIPYQLGYGTTAQSSIPAYSTLVFNITLASFYRQDADVPEYQ